MIKKITLLTLFCGFLMLPVFAQYFNVPVTGFNKDIVADGAVGVGSFSTTGSADVAIPPYVFVSTTFDPGSGVCANGPTALPASGTVTSTNTTNNTGITYTLQSYGSGTTTNDNVLQLATNVTGTLTLVTPVRASRLYLVCIGGSGASTYTVVVNFSDATSQTITTAPPAPDWCGGTSTYKLTTQSYYRINNNATTCNGGTCQYLYEIPVAIDAANYGKTINSITLTNLTTGTLFSVFAVGAQSPCAAPTAQPTALVLTGTSTSQIGGTFTAAPGTPTGYLVVRYPQGAVATPPVSGTAYAVGQALGLGKIAAITPTPSFSDAGLNGSTTYTYYIYAYNSGTTCGGPVYALQSPLTGSQSTNACGTLNGTVPIGPGLPNTPTGGYTSLTKALAYLNTSGLGGNTTLALQTGYDGTSANETFPITFPRNPCIGSLKTLTIRPATGVTGLSITNASDASPLIDFNGATYVTIDGVNNGLSISNTSTAATANTSTIRFINDASNNTVINCTVLGSSTGSLATTTGTIFFSTGVVTGNDDNTIRNCKIGPAGTNLPSKGIFAQGSTTDSMIANRSIIIADNEIYDFFLTGGCAGLYALTGNTDWSITGNKVYQTAPRTFTAGGIMNGLYFASAVYGQNIRIRNNIIGYANNAGTGILTLRGGTISGSFQGIYMSTLSAGATSFITDNKVSDIYLSSASGTFMGIANASGSNTDTIQIAGNQVKNINLDSIKGTVTGIAWGAAKNMMVTNNAVAVLGRTGAGTTYGIYGNGVSSNETIANNTVSGLNSTATAASSLYGIYQISTAGIKNYTNNSVFDFAGLAGTSIFGLRVNSGTSITITGNKVYELASFDGTAAASVTGIYTGTGGTLYNVYQNKVYNLSISSTGGVVYGIYNATSPNNIYNNLVGGLSSTAYTSITSPYLGVAGIYIASGNSNIYNNTVRLGAVSSSGTNFTVAGIYANTTPNVLLRNNLVVNLAVPAGSGKAVAYMRSSTTLTTYDAASATNSFYAGPPGAANVLFWDGTNAFQDLVVYKTAMGSRDQFSVSTNPVFVSTNGTDPTYLHIPVGATPNILESAGSIVSLFNIDYDGDARPGPSGSVNGGAFSYDIGADEFDGSPIITCVLPIPGNTISSAQTICVGASVTLSLQNPVPGNMITYQWYSSIDGGTTYTPITGAVGPTYTTRPLVTTYYKCTVTCRGSLTATSTPIPVGFVNNILTSTSAVRCGIGTLSLSAAANPSSTIRWYAVPTGGVPLAAGNSFTTPSIGTTTTYYAGAESSLGATIIPIGAGALTGTGVAYNPTSGSYGGIKTQHLYTAAELYAAGLAPGNITSLSLEFTTAGASLTGFYIEMGNTTLSDFATPVSIQGNLNPAYNVPTFVPAVGTNTFPLNTPFNWDGSSNVIVSFSWSNNNSSNTSSTLRYDNTTNFASHSYSKDSESPANMLAFTGSVGGAGGGAFIFNRSTNRPKISFNGQATCSSPRVAVNATVSTAPPLTISENTTVCNNQITLLTITSAAGDFNNYTWSPVTSLYTDAGATVPYIAGTNTTTVYAKTVTPGVLTYTANADNSTTFCANVATSAVTVLPATVTTIASPASICVTGSTTLSLSTASYGTATYQWQSSANNSTFADINGATSATYPTPTLISSAYYRASVKNSAGVTCLQSASGIAQVNIPAVTATTPGARCSTGTVTLGGTGKDGTLTWYSALTGGTSLGMGNAFVTPSISTTTTYYVEVRSTGTVTCVSGPRVPVIATINANPVAAISPKDTVAFCTGTTTTLTGTGGGTYQWRNAAGNIAGATSATLTTGNIGSYRLVVTTPVTGCTDTSAAVLLKMNPLPIVFIGNDTAFCFGDTLTLNAGNPGNGYLWNDGTTERTKKVRTTGTYKVTITDLNGCMQADSLSVLVRDLPVVHLGNDTSICSGVTYVLNAGYPGASYNWNKGGTEQTFEVTKAGVYRVVVTDAYACDGVDTINIVIKTAPKGNINAVHGDSATYTFNVLNPQYVLHYTWDFGDGSPLESGELVRHRYKENGIYTVNVKLGGECEDSVSKSRTVEVFDAPGGTSIRNISNDKDLVLYPNPAKNSVILENKYNARMKQIIVFNILGQVVSRGAADNSDKHVLNTSGWVDGIYTVRIETEKGYVIRKFEIMQ